MNKILILAVMMLGLLVVGNQFSISLVEAADPVYESSQAFIQQYFEFYNQQDFKTIYKDLTSSRLKSSDDFDHFAFVLAQIYQDFGVVTERKPNILLREDFEKEGLQFFRLEYLVSHEKGGTISRIVLMKDSDRWVIDGLAVADHDKIFLAVGNLYDFDWAKVITAKQPIWSSPQFKEVWKDTKTDYIESTDLGQLKGIILGPNDLPIGVNQINYNSDGSFNE